MPAINELLPILRIGAFILLFLAAGSLGASVLFFRRARLAAYYVIREQARKRGLIALTIAMITLVLGLLLLYLTPRLAPAPHPAPMPSLTPLVVPAVTQTPSPVATFPPTASPTPVPSPSATSTRRATATPPFPSPMPTRPYTLPETALTPQPGATPAGESARITFLTLALGEENDQPVEPGSEFAPGDHRVYLFFEYQGMTRGVVWTYGWYREGDYLAGDTRLWTLGESGTTYLYFKPPAGYAPGIYEVRVWIEDRFQGVAQFRIVAPE